MARGIKDKVAILGMGCARFGERWNDDAEQLMVEAFDEAMGDAGIEVSQIDAAWLSVAFDSVNIDRYIISYVRVNHEMAGHLWIAGFRECGFRSHPFALVFHFRCRYRTRDYCFF